MRKWLVLILLFGFILFPSPAGAEAGVKLDSLNIELLSEYDQPSMLVIHEFVVSRETPLPASGNFTFSQRREFARCCSEKRGWKAI